MNQRAGGSRGEPKGGTGGAGFFAGTNSRKRGFAENDPGQTRQVRTLPWGDYCEEGSPQRERQQRLGLSQPREVRGALIAKLS